MMGYVAIAQWTDKFGENRVSAIPMIFSSPTEAAAKLTRWKQEATGTN